MNCFTGYLVGTRPGRFWKLREVSLFPDTLRSLHFWVWEQDSGIAPSGKQSLTGVIFVKCLMGQALSQVFTYILVGSEGWGPCWQGLTLFLTSLKEGIAATSVTIGESCFTERQKQKPS